MKKYITREKTRTRKEVEKRKNSKIRFKEERIDYLRQKKARGIEERRRGMFFNPVESARKISNLYA